MHYALNNKYPIETSEQVKIAEEFFTKNLTKFDPADRVLAASNIEKRASELTVPVSKGWITNYSRMTKISAQISPSFEWNMKLRKEAASEEVNISGKMIKTASVIDNIVNLRNEGASGELIIAAIDELDKTAGLINDYDRIIVDPVMTVYGNLADPEFDRVKIASGITDYDAKSASRDEETLTKIASSFGSDVADSFKSAPMATILSTSGPELDILTGIING